MQLCVYFVDAFVTGRAFAIAGRPSTWSGTISI
jgi:hypothetical protein